MHLRYGRHAPTASFGLRDKPIAAASPCQNSFVELLIGLIRREFVDHIIVLDEAHPSRILKSYARHYDVTRTHLAWDKDAHISRPAQCQPPRSSQS